MINEMKNAARQWVLASTSHGIPSIFRVKGVFLKLIWICCFLASFIYCIISIGKSIQNFLSYPTQVSISLVQEIPTEFPAVSLCNKKSIDKVKAKLIIDEILLDSNGREKVPLSMFQEQPYTYMFVNQYILKSQLAASIKFNESIKRAIGFNISDMLISCAFDNNGCFDYDFKYYYSPVHGNCFTFNSGYRENGTKIETKKVSLTGPDYGFILELYLGNPTTQSRYEYSDGLIVSIHNQSVLPNFDADRIFVPVAAETDISVKRTYISRLNDPYGDCLMDISSKSAFKSYYFDYIVRTKGIAYNQKYCLELCAQKLLNDQCNCSMINFPFFDNSPSICYTNEQAECSVNASLEFSKILNKCKTSCPIECKYIEYSFSSSRLTYPSVFYRNVLANYSKIKSSGIANEDFDKTVLKLNVFYANTQYTLIKEQASTTNEQLLSNIGGILGLCIGVSLLSLIEIVEIIITLFHIWFKHKMNVNTATISERNNLY